MKKSFFDISGGFPKSMFFSLCKFLPQKLRQMKKFVLHYSRCTVVTRFKSRFCWYIKGGYPWNKVTKQKGCFFCLKRLFFFASDRLGRNFSTAQNSPEKRKNLYSIKLTSK